MKLWVDDIRTPPTCDWVWAQTFNDAYHILKKCKVREVSLDHDLGEKDTGYDLVKYIEEWTHKGNYVPPKIHCHSANPVGRRNILNAVSSIERMMEGV